MLMENKIFEMIEKREQYISVGYVDTDIESDIIDSWERSKKAGVDPRATSVPAPPFKNKAPHRKWLYRKEIMLPYLKRLTNIMETTQSVLFWVDEDLTILYPYGDETIQARLKSINFNAGVNLSEDIVGTNAIAMAERSGRESFVIGAEHYIEALRNYACSAVPFYYETSEDDSNAYGYSLVVTPVENFNIYQHHMLYFYSNLAKSQFQLTMYKNEADLRNELVNLSVEQDDKGILLINNRGLIIKANLWFLNNFEFCEQDVQGKFLKDVFPELLFTLDYLQGKKASKMNEIHFSKLTANAKSFFVDCQPIVKNNDVMGLSIFIQNKKNINSLVHKVANFNAHFEFDDLLGSNQVFLTAKNTAQNAAMSNSNILITGESGTGKDLFAQAIHNKSKRQKGPFISINCAAIPSELIGSELFGYVEGAFTGARKGGSPGKFELANKGTIFLDEIGEMPLAMQAVLLRVLEDKEVIRLGGSHPTPVDVRVISATNKDLLEAIEAKEFRLDLYYRLNVIQLELPALRERKSDISFLVNNFIKQFSVSSGKNITGITPEAISLLENYSWPGNIRELRNVIERAVNLSSSQVLTIDDLPKSITGNSVSPVQAYQIDEPTQQLFEEFKQKVDERNQIIALMKKYKNNKSHVAKELGITRASLYRRLKAMNYNDCEE